MRILLQVCVILLYGFGLTACQPPGPPPPLPERPAELLKIARVEIEMPDYMVFGQKTQIKLKMIAPEGYSITGGISLEDGTAGGFDNNYNLQLDTKTPERVVEYTPDLTTAEYGKIDLKTKFVGNDSENYSATTYSKSIPLYMRTIYAGPAQTIKSGTQERLNVKANQLLENQIGKLRNFTWEQLEGPMVELTKISEQDAEFTAPEVSNVTKIRFSIRASTDGGSHTLEEEKVFYIVPSNLWLKTVRTFQHDPIALREDGSAVVMSWSSISEYFVYQLQDQIEEIRNIIVGYSPSTIIVLNKNGTVKFITLDPYGNNQKTIKDDLPKEPITKENYSTDGIIFRANNIKEIFYVEAGGTYIKTFDNQQFNLDYSVYQTAEDTYSKASLNTITGGRNSFYFYDIALSETGELNGLFFNYPTNSEITTPFSMQNVAKFSPRHPIPFDRALFGYLLNDNTPGFLSATRKPTIWGVEPDTSPLPIRNELLKKSPFQSSPFVDVLPLGRHEEIYLLEDNGNVSSYHEGAWEDHTYLKNIGEIGAMAVRKDGTSIIWADPYQSPYSNSYLAKIRNGLNPNPANIKATNPETLIGSQ